MALKPCKECGNKISTKATQCPHCGAEAPKKRGLISTLFRWFMIIFVILPIGIGIVMMGFQGDNPTTTTAKATPTKPREPQPYDACEAAKDVVKSTLKAPKSAEFPGCVFEAHLYTIRKNEDGSLWQVEGHVDAQNSYGAMIRNRFAVRLKYTAGRWIADDVTVTE